MTTEKIIAEAIRNLPAILFVLALAGAAAFRKPGKAAENLLSWLLLLPIGVTGLWAGFFHVFAPEVAAAHIGWSVSPFQFEVGMADFAVGIVGVLAFWKSLDFKEAATYAASVFLLGDAVGHIRQMLEAGNFAPGNAGVPFVMDIVCPALALTLLLMTRRHR